MNLNWKNYFLLLIHYHQSINPLIFTHMPSHWSEFLPRPACRTTASNYRTGVSSANGGRGEAGKNARSRRSVWYSGWRGIQIRSLILRGNTGLHREENRGRQAAVRKRIYRERKNGAQR